MPRIMNAKEHNSRHTTGGDRYGYASDPFFEQFLWPEGCYLHEERQGDYLVVKKAAHGGAAVRIRRECLDCSLTEPLCGFAPVFNLTPDARGETLILVCNDCYNRRCNEDGIIESLQQQQRERKAG
jgi:hypothetical protein